MIKMESIYSNYFIIVNTNTEPSTIIEWLLSHVTTLSTRYVRRAKDNKPSSVQHGYTRLKICI
jgi:hypothetical protein